jgi:CRISPR/Cas system CMR subunit Cmr4 (Cas7 group RAMP superfamily)
MDQYSQLSCCIKQSFECNVLLQPIAIERQRQVLRRGCPWRKGVMPSETIFFRRRLNIPHLRVF